MAIRRQGDDRTAAARRDDLDAGTATAAVSVRSEIAASAIRHAAIAVARAAIASASEAAAVAAVAALSGRRKKADLSAVERQQTGAAGTAVSSGAAGSAIARIHADRQTAPTSRKAGLRHIGPRARSSVAAVSASAAIAALQSRIRGRHDKVRRWDPVKPDRRRAEDELLTRQRQPRGTAAATTATASTSAPMSDEGVSIGVAAVRSGSAIAAIPADQVDRLVCRQQCPVEIETDGSPATAAATAAIMSRGAGSAMRGRASCRTGLPDMAEISGWNRRQNG